jgi:hypothetical protein
MSTPTLRRHVVRAPWTRVVAQGLLWLMASEFAGRRARAQEGRPSRLRLVLSFKKDRALPTTALELRPNLPQEVFVYVQNDGDDDQRVAVKLVGGDGKAVATSAEVTAEKGKATLVTWPATPAEPGKPSPPQELAGPVTLRMADKGGEVGKALRIDVAPPRSYLKDPQAEFFAEKLKNGETRHRLVVTVERNTTFPFGGPPTRVELDLNPARFKALVPGQEKRGRYTGLISADSGKLVLQAEGLQLEGSEPGFVYLNVDGVPRAFVLGATFPSGEKPTTSLLSTKPILATSLPRYLPKPTGPTPVAIEASGPVSVRYRIKLDLLAASEKKKEDEKDVVKDTYAEVAEFKGPYQEKLFFGKTGPNGGLLLQPEVKEWATALDLSGVVGTTKVRLRLLDEDNKLVKVINGLRVPVRKEDEDATEVVQEVTIDVTPPAVELLAPVPARAVRDRRLLVKARCADEESGVAEVMFYLGKPAQDGKMAPDTPRAKGRPDKETDVWQAEFDIPADQKGPLGLTVRATNGVGMTTSKTVALDVVDPEPTAATIAGKVYEKETPIDNVVVRLYNAKKQLIRRVRSADGGKFAFRELRAGEYRIAALRPSTGYGVERVVAVKDREQLVNLELILQPGKGRKARISGVVREGDRVQAGLTVTLSDAASNKALLTAKTDEAGKYEFKDLGAGKYKVTATKSASQTKAEKPVVLQEGEDKSDVDLKLYR